MKYAVKVTSKFKKDYKLVKKQGKNMKQLDEVISTLANGEPLSAKYYDYALSGNWAGHRECHITPDWLLIYYIEDDVLVLTFSRTGSHSELFNK